MRSTMKLALLLLPLTILCPLVGAAAQAIEKQRSLVTKQPIGELAVAGRLSIDLHAEFMVSRTMTRTRC